METGKFNETAPSLGRPGGDPQHEGLRSPVLAEVQIEAPALHRRSSVRAADELSDEEAEAFFFA